MESNAAVCFSIYRLAFDRLLRRLVGYPPRLDRQLEQRDSATKLPQTKQTPRGCDLRHPHVERRFGMGALEKLIPYRGSFRPGVTGDNRELPSIARD